MTAPFLLSHPTVPESRPRTIEPSPCILIYTTNGLLGRTKLTPRRPTLVNTSYCLTRPDTQSTVLRYLICNMFPLTSLTLQCTIPLATLVKAPAPSSVSLTVLSLSLFNESSLSRLGNGVPTSATGACRLRVAPTKNSIPLLETRTVRDDLAHPTTSTTAMSNTFSLTKTFKNDKQKGGSTTILSICLLRIPFDLPDAVCTASIRSLRRSLPRARKPLLPSLRYSVLLRPWFAAYDTT